MSDPRIFNYVILGMFCVAAVRWAIAGHWGQTLYWASSAALTVAVTWGMQR